jgi:diaminopimelate epimerase
VPGDAGNPHAVCFVDELVGDLLGDLVGDFAGDVEQAPVAAIGAALQTHPAFPDGVNVEFVQRLASDRLRQRTFERGSGETLACGTGAAVAVVAARQRGVLLGERTAVELRGGVLIVDGPATALAIEGPARSVFSGEIAVPNLGPAAAVLGGSS